MPKDCVLEEKICINCKKCLYCDLDNTKICDNCCECFSDAEYTGVEIDDIILDEA